VGNCRIGLRGDNLGAASSVATVTESPADKPSNGGGGAINWLSVVALGLLAATR
jgi:hypothetical protein